MPELARLDFVLPDFTRVAWVSKKASQVWKPRLQQISYAWGEIGWQSVAAGLRPAFITSLSPEAIVEESGRWSACGLAMLPLALEARARDSYAATPRPVLAGESAALRIAVGSQETLVKLRRAWDTRDDETIGQLLGYPACCRAFFRRVWVEQAYVDTTWSMATNTVPSTTDQTTINVYGAPLANILWRWLGVRAVPHLPCRFDCVETLKLGEQMLDLGRSIGFTQEMEWIAQILRWPLEWSALHGIAEILTPIVNISTRTDATARRFVVRWQGETYPAEGAQGLRFPYTRPNRFVVTRSRAFKRGMSEALQTPIPNVRPNWYHRDNGFSSEYAMHRAHEPIVNLARATLEGKSGKVLDLGCGNGALVAKVCEGHSDLIPFGIDRSPISIQHAREVLPTVLEEFLIADMFDTESWTVNQPYALIILMVGRLLEVSPDSAQRVIESLKRCSADVLGYVYDGPSSESFPDLVARAGLEVAKPGENKCGLLKLN